MFDLRLRPIKDQLFHPLSRVIPRRVSPNAITAVGFGCGLAACAFAGTGHVSLSVVFWLLNRALDCLDGSFARISGQQSDWGGFLDLLADFIVYSLIPICCVRCRRSDGGAPYGQCLVVMLLEASFHINNFVLFFHGAVVEKAKARVLANQREAHHKTTSGLHHAAEELTTIAMQPALIEGFEAGIFFTLMLMFRDYLFSLSLLMLLGVTAGTTQRAYCLARILQSSAIK